MIIKIKNIFNFIKKLFLYNNILYKMSICSPALLYLFIGIIAIISMIYSKTNMQTIAMQGLFVAIWTLFLNFLCSKGHEGISWFLVILPFVVMALFIVAMSNIIGGKMGQNKEMFSTNENDCYRNYDSPECKEYCKNNLSNLSNSICDDYCTYNPESPECNEYCKSNLSQYQCRNYCKYYDNYNLPECKEYCKSNLGQDQCIQYCLNNSNSDECKEYCKTNKKYPGCY
jgi:uncharacterized membrane protein